MGEFIRYDGFHMMNFTRLSSSWLVNYKYIHLPQLSVPIFITVVVPFVSFLPQDGWTALMLASDSGHTDIVQLLLSSGAKVDLQNKVRHSIMF